MRLFKVFHQDGHHHIDQDKLSHQHEDHEEERGEYCCYTAVLETVRGAVTLLSDDVHCSGGTSNEEYCNKSRDHTMCKYTVSQLAILQ